MSYSGIIELIKQCKYEEAFLHFSFELRAWMIIASGDSGYVLNLHFSFEF